MELGPRKRFRSPRARTSFRVRRRARRLNPRQGGFMGQELKFYDTSLVADDLVAPTDSAGAEIDPSATIVLNSVVQGDGESNRDGRQISMVSIKVKGIVKIPKQSNQTSTDSQPVVKLYLVLDTQTNGATINSEDVFTNPGANAATASSAFRNMQNIMRFKILASATVNLNIGPLSWDGTNMEQTGAEVPWEMFANLRGMRTNYKGTTESVANITDNSLHMIGFTSDVTTAPNVSYNARLRFRG